MENNTQIMTKKQYKMQCKEQKRREKKIKSGATDAMELYKLKKKIRKPITFGKLMFWLLLFICLTALGLFLGFYFTVDRFDFMAILHKMFEALKWPDIVNMLFNY